MKQDINEINLRFFLKDKGWMQLPSNRWLDPIDAKIYLLEKAFEVQKKRDMEKQTSERVSV